MDKNIVELLGGSLSKTSVNTDIYTSVEFKQTSKVLPTNDINSVLDINKQFNVERQACTKYRLLGKINPLISNVLFNIDGPNSWDVFNQPIFTSLKTLSLPLTYPESIANNLMEIDGWYGYFSGLTSLSVNSVCKFNDMEPKRNRFSFTPDTTNNNIDNFYTLITYPYASDSTHNLVKGGLLIATSLNVTVGGKPMTAIYVPVNHNLSTNDTVLLTGTSNDGIYNVTRVGLDDGSYKENFFCIDIIGLTVSNNSRMVKIYNNIPSTYYFRKFTKMKTTSNNTILTTDCEITNLGFSENIFADTITQFIYTEDLDVNGLTDNLGRPLSELYLTTIKTSSNGIFSNISSGLEVPFIDLFVNLYSGSSLYSIPIIQAIHNVSGTTKSFTPLETNVLSSNSDFYGDIVEYNTTTVQEVILSTVNHRFNTINRESSTGTTVVGGPRPEGYYYQAHLPIKIREFGSFIQQGDSQTVDIPSYAETLPDGRFLWRDLLDIGYVDINQPVLNYPFLNGKHYIYQNYDFVLKRQDPFDYWKLYYSTFPADPSGQIMKDNHKINSVDITC